MTTNSSDPGDRINDIDQRLQVLEEGFSQYRSEQQSIAALQNLTSELADIARLHQQALRQSQRRFEEQGEENRRIWQYLLGQQGNGNGGSEG